MSRFFNRPEGDQGGQILYVTAAMTLIVGFVAGGILMNLGTQRAQQSSLISKKLDAGIQAAAGNLEASFNSQTAGSNKPSTPVALKSDGTQPLGDGAVTYSWSATKVSDTTYKAELTAIYGAGTAKEKRKVRLASVDGYLIGASDAGKVHYKAQPSMVFKNTIAGSQVRVRPAATKTSKTAFVRGPVAVWDGRSQADGSGGVFDVKFTDNPSGDDAKATQLAPTVYNNARNDTGRSDITTRWVPLVMDQQLALLGSSAPNCPTPGKALSASTLNTSTTTVLCGRKLSTTSQISLTRDLVVYINGSVEIGGAVKSNGYTLTVISSGKDIDITQPSKSVSPQMNLENVHIYAPAGTCRTPHGKDADKAELTLTGSLACNEIDVAGDFGPGSRVPTLSGSLPAGHATAGVLWQTLVSK